MRLTRDAQNVSPNNRSQRLNTRSLPLELEDLAKAFNGALERIDHAYGRLESFNADVAHELHTPVTILIGQTEVALTRDRSIDELRHTLQSNLEEFEHVRAIINDMLFLARADQGKRATGLVEVSLAAKVHRTLEFNTAGRCIGARRVERRCVRVRQHVASRTRAVESRDERPFSTARPARRFLSRSRASMAAFALRWRIPASRLRRTSWSICSTVSIARKARAPTAAKITDWAGDRQYETARSIS